MNGTRALKIFISISMGIHLLLLTVFTLLFPNFKIHSLPPLHMEVSLLHFIPERDKPLKVTQKEPPLRPRVIGVRQEEETPFQEMKIEAPVFKEVKSPEPPRPVQEEIKMVPRAEPAQPSFEDEKKERGGVNEKPIAILPSQNLAPQASFSEKSQVAIKTPSPSEGEIHFAQPRYAENPKPIYPREAKRRGYEGEVILRVEVLTNGQVGQIEVRHSSGHEMLDQSAIRTVKQWRFIPAQKGEQRVSVWVNIPVKFQLQ